MILVLLISAYIVLWCVFLCYTWLVVRDIFEDYDE